MEGGNDNNNENSLVSSGKTYLNENEWIMQEVNKVISKSNAKKVMRVGRENIYMKKSLKTTCTQKIMRLSELQEHIIRDERKYY